MTRGTGPEPVEITVDGERVVGAAGQSIAAVLLGAGTVSWRRTSLAGRGRGLFCGVGVCFDCVVEVNGLRDVRACRRRARAGDDVRTQHDVRPGACPPHHEGDDDGAGGTGAAGAPGPGSSPGTAAGVAARGAVPERVRGGARA